MDFYSYNNPHHELSQLDSYFELTPDVTDAFVVSEANEKYVRGYGLVM